MNKGSIKAINPPATISGGFTLLALVHNASDHLWESAAGPNSIHITYHWLDADWNLVLFDTKRTPLPEATIAPKTSAQIEVFIDPPAQPGQYHLCLTLVEEGSGWFEAGGALQPHVLDMEFLGQDKQVSATEGTAPLRLAFVGSPRSGNVWLNRVLSDLLSLKPHYHHTPDSVEWNTLPPRSILQLHWKPQTDFQEELRILGFIPIVLQRHPLDLLISILHFCRFEPQTAHWLAGYGGNEISIANATPVDQAFIEYACSHRAVALLSLSSEWVNQPGTITVRYEQLVAEPIEAVSAVFRQIAAAVDQTSIEAALEKHSLSANRQTSGNSHFWMGRPGLWRQLILAKDAVRIARAHSNLFAAQNYRLDPDEALTASQSLEFWNEISLAPAGR